MDPDFWHERWTRGEIGFHQHDYNRHMQAFTGRLEIDRGAHVLVPLCGKSLDMLWLLGQGYRVSGIEISPLAVQEFFAENGLEPELRPFGDGLLYRCPGLDIYCSDFFEFDLGRLAPVDAVYDRASLVALPAHMRPSYAQHLAGPLRPETRSLLVTLDYPPDEMAGPPFSVTAEEVERLFGADFRIDPLYSEDCLQREPRFREKGLTRLEEQVFLLRRI
jgi:thiopurine S-methyltransferase